MSYAIKVEDGLKILFRLSPNVWYYGQTFGVLLHSGSRVAGRTFGKYLVDQVFVNECSVWSHTIY